MIYMNCQSVYVQYIEKNADRKTHGGDSGTKADTNDKHTQIDGDESRIDEDNHKLKRRR